MNNITTRKSPYLAYYGMQREPFAEAIEDDLFYPEPVRKQRLDILLHLTQYGNELMLVTGPNGSGKTTLLQQFQRKALDSWSVARIEAKGGLDERKMLQQLYRQMGLEFNGATHVELLEQMTHHFDALQRSARQAVMLIDDADLLPVTALKKVLELAALTNKENKPLLRIILFGNDTLMQNLQDPRLGRHAELPRRVLDLPPFDREHTTHYILHRLSAAQFSASEPFTDSALQKLYKQSGGWPKRINALAHNLLMDSLPAQPRETVPGIDDAPTFRPLRIVGILAGSAVIIGLLLFQDEINQLFQPAEETTTVALPLPKEEDEGAQQTSIPKDTSSTDLPPAFTRPQETAQQAETEETATAETVPEPVTAAKPFITETPTALEAEPDVSAPETAAAPTEAETVAPASAPTEAATPRETSEPPVVEAKPVTTAPVTTAKMTPPATKSAPAKDAPAAPPAAALPDNLPQRQDAWLRQQNPAHYTLQLVAGEHPDTIRKFITEHKLADDLALYHSTRNDKPWFGLTYGIYPDKQAAIDARARLPKGLRRLKPWVRDLGSIQATLN